MDDENVVNVSENEANENENEFITNSFTERGEDDINFDVGNDSRKQERAGERNDKSYSQLGEKSDYNIYNPAIIADISFQLSRTTPNVENNVTSYTLNVGDFYPLLLLQIKLRRVIIWLVFLLIRLISLVVICQKHM